MFLIRSRIEIPRFDSKEDNILYLKVGEESQVLGDVGDLPLFRGKILNLLFSNPDLLFAGLWSPIMDSRIRVFPHPVGPRRE
jgi:hypothetical protein